jgi:hypothetical protein
MATESPYGETLPGSMDRWARNQRLYETLKGLGLFVDAIPEPGDPARIRQMIVSVDPPMPDAAAAGIDRGAQAEAPEKAAAAPAIRCGDNVVAFPKRLRRL